MANPSQLSRIKVNKNVENIVNPLRPDLTKRFTKLNTTQNTIQ